MAPRKYTSILEVLPALEIRKNFKSGSQLLPTPAPTALIPKRAQGAGAWKLYMQRNTYFCG